MSNISNSPDFSAHIHKIMGSPLREYQIYSLEDRLQDENAPQMERRLLYICGFAPHPNSSSSGQKIAFAKIEEFSRSFARIDVFF